MKTVLEEIVEKNGTKERTLAIHLQQITRDVDCIICVDTKSRRQNSQIPNCCKPMYRLTSQERGVVSKLKSHFVRPTSQSNCYTYDSN